MPPKSRAASPRKRSTKSRGSSRTASAKARPSTAGATTTTRNRNRTRTRTRTASKGTKQKKAAKKRTSSPKSYTAVREVPSLMKMESYRFPDASMMANTTAMTTHAASHHQHHHSTSKLFILAQMLACVAGIYFCFSMWSLKQERLVTIPYYGNNKDGSSGGERFPTVFGAGLAQNTAGFCVALAIISGGKVLDRVKSRCRVKPSASYSASSSSSSLSVSSQWTITRQDVRALATVGFATAFSGTLAYSAMRRLPFPVVLATKMSKMIPVMVVGFLLYGTRYSGKKLLSCAVITAGIMTFYLLDSNSSKKTHTTTTTTATATTDATTLMAGGGDGAVGFLLLFLNLCLDGFANATQDVMAKGARASGWTPTRMMLVANLSAALWALAVMLLLDSALLARFAEARLPGSIAATIPFGDLSATAAFLIRHPDAAADLAAMSLTNAIGQVFVYQTIALFGTLTLTAMTLVRKAGSVLLSISVNGHSVSRPQWAALVVVMGSVVLEAYVNVTETSEKRKRQQQQQQQEEGETSAAALGRKNR